MPLKTEIIHARVDPALKRAAESVFGRLGLTTTEAIRLFLKQVELHKGLPFPVRIPNKETIKAIREIDEQKGLKQETLEQFKKSLGL